MVFGESLINDGVAVVAEHNLPWNLCQVLYKMMNSFAGIISIGETVTLTNCLMGLLSFCTIALGGLFIGGSMSFLGFGKQTQELWSEWSLPWSRSSPRRYYDPLRESARYSTYHPKVRVIEPLAVLSCAYLSYMLAELVSFSGGAINSLFFVNWMNFQGSYHWLGVASSRLTMPSKIYPTSLRRRSNISLQC